MQLKDFLSLVLPQQGSKCWVTINKSKRVRQFFTDSLDVLAAEIESAVTVDGMDIYFACASFKDDSSRRGQNALMAKAFWMDIDCGEGKPYADAHAGVQALDEFANRLGLPLPLCICSGSGVHAYWPLRDALPAARWTESARMLKHAAKVLGLKADPARTADISSILRPPGTSNFKRGVEQVYVIDGYEHEDISAEDFISKIAKYSVEQTSPIIPNKVALAPSIIHDSVAANILSGHKGQPSMTQGFPDGERTQALAARAGWLLAKGYSEEETLKLCREWNALNTPPKDDAALVHDVRSYAQRQQQKVKQVVTAPLVEESIPAPRWPYFMNATTGALEIELKDENGTKYRDMLSPYYIYLKDVCRREGEDKISYVFRQWHPHNGWHEFAISAGDFQGANWKGLLHDNGADIVHKLFKTYIEVSAIQLKGQAMDAVQYEQFGWKDNDTAFLVGNALIKNDGTAKFAYGDKNLAPRMKALSPAKNGSLEIWSAAANKCYGAGYEAHGFALLAGFAAPLMRFVCGNTDGGAILALYSASSGHGKSKVLEAISSIWGEFDGLSTAGKDTLNAKFGIISRACHLPFYEEELGQRDPVIAADFVKDFTMGRDKNRAQRDGSVALRNTRYQTIMISASNRSLYEIVKQSGDQGAVARIFEITVEMPEGDDFKHFRDVANQMILNRGFAGRAFIHTLMRPGVLPWVKQALAEQVNHYIKTLETRAEHRFIVWLMATCHVAAKLLNAAGILNFDTDRIIKWAAARACTRIGDDTVADSEEILNRFINEHVFDCLVVTKEHNGKQPAQILRYPTRRLIMRMERDNRKLYIAVDPLREWLSKHNQDYNIVFKTLERRYIVSDNRKQMTLGAGTDLPSGRVRCWEVDIGHGAMSGALKVVEKTPDGVITKVKF